LLGLERPDSQKSASFMTPAKTEARVGRRAWVTALLLAIVACLNYADRTAISSVFPLLRSDLGVSDLQLAAIGSFFLWSYAIGSSAAGLLADRLSRSRIIVTTLVAWSLVTICTGLSRNITELLITRVLLGIAECCYLPAAIALIGSHHPPSTRGTALGIHLFGLNLGLIVGAD